MLQQLWARNLGWREKISVCQSADKLTFDLFDIYRTIESPRKAHMCCLKLVFRSSQMGSISDHLIISSQQLRLFPE